MLPEIASIIIGYLLGSIPVAYIIAKMRKNIDIRDVDTRNMGGGSVLRQVGIWEGAVVIVVDMGKGAAPIFIAQAFGVSLPWVLAAGFAAILGHNYPVYVGFRGGQGVSTIMGIFFVITPLAMAVIFGVMGIVLLITRRRFTRLLFVVVCIISPLLPLLAWLFYGSEMMIVYYALVIIVFLLFKNRRRLKEVLVVLRPQKERQQPEIEAGEISPADD
jgi:glycerol-3-phosphate acyltransferase PlsY